MMEKKRCWQIIKKIEINWEKSVFKIHFAETSHIQFVMATPADMRDYRVFFPVVKFEPNMTLDGGILWMADHNIIGVTRDVLFKEKMLESLHNLVEHLNKVIDDLDKGE